MLDLRSGGAGETGWLVDMRAKGSCGDGQASPFCGEIMVKEFPVPSSCNVYIEDAARGRTRNYRRNSTAVLTELAMKQAACARSCSFAYSSALGFLSPEKTTFGARMALTTASLPSAFLSSTATASSW